MHGLPVNASFGFIRRQVILLLLLLMSTRKTINRRRNAHPSLKRDARAHVRNVRCGEVSTDTFFVCVFLNAIYFCEISGTKHPLR